MRAIPKTAKQVVLPLQLYIYIVALDKSKNQLKGKRNMTLPLKHAKNQKPKFCQKLTLFANSRQKSRSGTATSTEHKIYKPERAQKNCF